MKISEAVKIFERRVLVDKPECALLQESTLEHGSCFVFYYQSKQYIQSGKFSDMYVGQGPVIVCKETGGVFETGSAFPTEHYVFAFEACGDPLAEPTASISISHWSEGASAVKAIKCIQSSTGKGLAQSKPIIDQVLDGECVFVELSSVEIVKTTIETLSEYGFYSEQLWSNQC